MSEKLQGRTTHGDFVIQSQGTAEKEGFSHVSQYWFPNTKPIADGYTLIKNDRLNTEDICSPLRDMTPIVADDDQFVLRYKDGRTFVPTAHAHTQAGSKADFATGFIAKLTSPKVTSNEDVLYHRDRQDAETVKAIYANAIRRLPQDKMYLWRTRKPTNGPHGELRAMLTDHYAIINNEWFLDLLATLLPGSRLSHWRGDSDTIYGNVLIPDTIRKEEDSDYGGMISISNCEIGTRRFNLQPSVFRAICMNGCIWDQEVGRKVNLVHRGNINLRLLANNVRENIHTQLDLLTTGIDALLNTKNLAFTMSAKPIFAQVSLDCKLSKKEAKKVLEAYHSPLGGNHVKSLFGVINSLTLAGQGLNNARWVELDEIAGKYAYYDNRKWDTLVNRAGNLSVEQVEEVFATAV